MRGSRKKSAEVDRSAAGGISVDGRGQWRDNSIVERLWRPLPAATVSALDAYLQNHYICEK